MLEYLAQGLQPYWNYLYITLLLVLVAAIGILLFMLLVRVQRLMIANGTHPAIIHFVHEAIVLAYKSSDAVFDTVEERLYGAQKQEIAIAVYAILPDTVTVGFIGVTIPWKSYVSEAKFAEFVVREYDTLVVRFGVIKNTILQQMIDEIGDAPTDTAKRLATAQ